MTAIDEVYSCEKSWASHSYGSERWKIDHSRMEIKLIHYWEEKKKVMNQIQKQV